ncbi:MAG TPA: AAA family ATPase [Arachnia sp.]|nr:AAA family ATPase [Arachnia sp.]
MWHRRPTEPAVLGAAKDRLTEETAHAWRQKRSRGPEPDPLLHDPEILNSLLGMTNGTCAYCERSLEMQGSDAAVVTHHRPTWGAVGTDGDVSLQAYWWLSYEWDNLFPACADCIRSRGTRFPVAGPRATSPDGLPAEQPLLLDPLDDDPDEHLRYQADGTVTALTDRGRATIDILALNRDFLVKARLTALNSAPDNAFSTLHRQFGGYAQSAPPEAAAPPPPPPRLSGPDLPPMSGAEPGAPAYDLTSNMAGAQRGNYFQATQWIERVVIRNFRPIRDLEIDLAKSTSERGPWTVLLGENGCGKSSVLHAIALTMMGGEQRRALGIDARKFLRDGARKGLVEVYLSGRQEPLRLEWAKGEHEFTGPEPVAALMLGYGATRLLPRTPSPHDDDRVVRVDNLFDPVAPLTDPTSWLLSLDDDTFDDVAHGIHEMLALDQDAELLRDDDQVLLKQGRTRSDIVTLSDGYQSMVVMACDILRSTMRLWTQSALAEGIVLIDEIGAHLHPRWRLRIVTAMRNLMPRIQFIVTTHDPLCLRGIVDGEVVVMRRNSEGDVISLSDLPPVTGMRIDQLLTSEHFGLGSTDDPEVTELWENYYRLMGLKKPSKEQTDRLERVRARLDELEQFGTTERERLLLTSAADYIAQRRETGDTVAPSSKEMTAKLSELWGKYLPGSS